MARARVRPDPKPIENWKSSIERRAQKWRASPERFKSRDPVTGADAELASILAAFRACGRSIDDAAETLGIDPAYAKTVQQRAVEALAQADYRNAAIVRSDANSQLDMVAAELSAIGMDRDQPAEVRVKALTALRQTISDRVDLYGAKAKPIDADLDSLAVEVLEIAQAARGRDKTLTIDAIVVTDAMGGGNDAG